jgi:hypothetical protein
MCAERDGNSTDEIEITEAMMLAGCHELAYYDPINDIPRPTVLAIFEAMIRAHGKYSLRLAADHL